MKFTQKDENELNGCLLFLASLAHFHGRHRGHRDEIGAEGFALADGKLDSFGP